MNPPREHPADRLADAIARVGSPLCVGFDPDWDRLPDCVRTGGSESAAPASFEAFCGLILEATEGVSGIVKLQAACFERYGPEGYAALGRCADAAREAGRVVILDAKRGDIGVTARHYAAAGVRLGADWITVSPYLGPETMQPYLDAGLGIFALVRTSNPDSDRVQSARLAAEGSVAEHVARLVAALGSSRIGECGLSAVGAVVAATKPGEAAALRSLMPDQPFLMPGIGAQGGDAAEAAAALRPDAGVGAGGVLPSASRSILYPGGDLQRRAAAVSAVRAAATAARRQTSAS